MPMVTYQLSLADFPVSLSVSQVRKKDVKTKDGCGEIISESFKKHGLIGLLLRTVQGCYSLMSGGGVQDSLEREGFELLALRVPAQSVGAPHIRERAFIIAHSKNESGLETDKAFKSIRKKGVSQDESMCCSESDGSSNSQSFRCGESENPQSRILSKESRYSSDCFISSRRDRNSEEEIGKRFRDPQLPDWKKNPPAICRMDDGISYRLDKPRLQALGNAIVPRVIYPIFRAIKFIETGE